GISVSFNESEVDPIIGYRLPVTEDGPPWERDWRDKTKHWFVDPKSWINADNPSTVRYPSFELTGPKPPEQARTPRQRVAFWLSLHKQEIVDAQERWNVPGTAIAGVIAWEALHNSQAFSISSVGPGKMHLHGADGFLSWPEVVERTGRVKSLSDLERKILMANPGVAINYIGASLDLAANIAEKYGWDIRENPEILGQVYHSYWPEQWLTHMSTKSTTEKFQIVPGTMGKWIQGNSGYLRSS